MPHFTTLASRLMATCGALALAVVLVGQTVGAPQAGGSGRIASAYVGAVA